MPVQTLTVRVPFTIRKRGGRKLAIAADGSTLASPLPRIDSTLVKALARAHRWNKMLKTGRYSSAAELAAAENQPALRQPGAAANLVSTGHRGSDRRGAAG